MSKSYISTIDSFSSIYSQQDISNMISPLIEHMSLIQSTLESSLSPITSALSDFISMRIEIENTLERAITPLLGTMVPLLNQAACAINDNFINALDPFISSIANIQYELNNNIPTLMLSTFAENLNVFEVDNLSNKLKDSLVSIADLFEDILEEDYDNVLYETPEIENIPNELRSFSSPLRNLSMEQSYKILNYIICVVINISSLHLTPEQLCIINLIALSLDFSISLFNEK